MWIYLCLTDSTSSAASEEYPSHCETTCDQSPTAKSTPIVKESCCPEWQVATSITRLSGMMLKHSTERIWKLSTLSSAASLDYARTLALQDMEKAWQESEVDFSSRSCAWPKKSSPSSYSWKTQKESCQTGESKLSKRLPPSGIAAVGLLRAVKRLDHPKIVKDGFVLPTLTAREAPDCPSERKRHSPSLNCILNIQNNSHGLKTNPNFLEWMMSYPFDWTVLSHWVIPYVLDKRKKRSKS